MSKNASLGLLAATLAYMLLRIFAIPTAAAQSNSFTHDSAYISIVADQVRTGNGLVNPAHWLVFLNPSKLPQPLHNANPGYILTIATVGTLIHWDSPRTGLLISALSSVLLLTGIFFLLRQYQADWRWAALTAALVALFPANFADSLGIIPDALCTALCVWAIAFAVRKPAVVWNMCLAGVLLGLAWLCRSSAILVWPALLWWIFRGIPWRNAAFAMASFLITISPWLIHTNRVWGSPLRSDASIYLFQSYHTLHRHITMEQFYRSLEPPPSPGSIIKSDPVDFAKYYVRQIPRMLYLMLATATGWNKFYTPPFIGTALIAAFAARRYWRTPECQAALILIFLTFAVLNIRADSFELRYLGPALIAVIIMGLLPARRLFDDATKGSSALAYAAVVCVALTCLLDVGTFRKLTAPSTDNRQLLADSTIVTREFAGPIVAENPYFFTYFSGRSAIAPPVANQQQLSAYMDRFGARYLALPTTRIAELYPSNSLAEPGFHAVKQVGTLTVLEKTP